MEGKDDNQNQDSGKFFLSPATTVAPPPSPPPPPPPPPAEVTVGGVIIGSDGFKKKRGRPRKYGPDGKPTVTTLSPMPISASIPLTGDYQTWKPNHVKPLTLISRKQKLEFCTPDVVGEQVAYSVGPNFTPHVLTVNSGEDVNMKIISFAQQQSQAICVLAANGAISNVTLRQPNSSGGTLTYEVQLFSFYLFFFIFFLRKWPSLRPHLMFMVKTFRTVLSVKVLQGRFDILSLSGAFTSNDTGGAKGTSGGMSVSLAGPDGRVLGGGLAGMLVAASPIQVILGSFLPGNQHEPQISKKSRFEPVTAISPPIMAAMPIFKETTNRAHGEESNLSFTLTSPTTVSRGLAPKNKGSLRTSEPNVVSTSLFGVSC